jgi:thiamine biosynthesis lipoprotein
MYVGESADPDRLKQRAFREVGQRTGGKLLQSVGELRRFPAMQQWYVKHAGVRYGHVLDPRSGWPIPDAPRSVTVHAATCTEAGLLAKLALLRGADAEAFLRAEQVRASCVR